LGTDPNRRLNDLIGGIPDLKIDRDQAQFLRGQYRLVLLRKERGAAIEMRGIEKKRPDANLNPSV
jgi:hypothetical protein